MKNLSLGDNSTPCNEKKKRPMHAKSNTENAQNTMCEGQLANNTKSISMYPSNSFHTDALPKERNLDINADVGRAQIHLRGQLYFVAGVTGSE